MPHYDFMTTPELIMYDSLPSTPTSSHCHLEFPEPSTPRYEAPAFADTDTVNMLKLFVENAFEKDAFCQSYLTSLSESQKDDLKLEIISSPSLIKSVRGESPNSTPRPTLSRLLHDHEPAYIQCPGAELHEGWRNLDLTPTYSDPDPTFFSPFDPASYFDFSRTNPVTNSTEIVANEALYFDFSRSNEVAPPTRMVTNEALSLLFSQLNDLDRPRGGSEPSNTRWASTAPYWGS